MSRERPSRRGQAAILLVLVCSVFVVGPASASVALQPTVYVSMMDNYFQPQTLSINAGATLIWTNNGNVPHTATSDTGLWDSATLGRGQTYSRVFGAPGIFPYNCVFHRALGMVGTITVLGTQPTATATLSPTPTRTPVPATATATPTRTPTPVPPTATPTAVPASPTPTSSAAPTATPTSAPLVAPGVTPAATVPPAVATSPPVVPTPAALVNTGENTGFWLPWALALASLAIVLGLALSLLARR